MAWNQFFQSGLGDNWSFSPLTTANYFRLTHIDPPAFPVEYSICQAGTFDNKYEIFEPKVLSLESFINTVFLTLPNNASRSIGIKSRFATSRWQVNIDSDSIVLPGADVKFDTTKLESKLDLISANLAQGAGLFSRLTKVHQSSILAPDASESASISLAYSYNISRISTSLPARIRLYESTTALTTDMDRPVGVDPSKNHGVILDVVTTSDKLALALNPIAFGKNSDQTISTPALIQNLSNNNSSISINFTYILGET